MKTIRQFATEIALIVTIASTSHARPMAHWPYDKLTAEADLIVIATPTVVNDTGGRTQLPGGIRRTGEDNVPERIPAVEMEATFEVLAVLKGEVAKEFTFHYLREEPPPKQPVPNSAGLVSFEPKEKKRFLLFLRRESTGGFSSLTGQIDPIQGLKDLGTYP